MEKITGRVLEVTHKPYEWQGKTVDKWEVSVQVGTETKKYDCGYKKITEMQGKEIEFTAEPGKGNYNAKMKLEDGKPAFNKPGGKSYVDNSGTTAWDTILMVAKDLYIAGKVKDSAGFAKFQEHQWKKYQEHVHGKTNENTIKEVMDGAVDSQSIPF